ncbi:MAG: hypothetical protein IJS50_02400, partial [Desulfovibrio sp.]|nr:hypothetical protein [Desulfovibrio sp.]
MRVIARRITRQFLLALLLVALGATFLRAESLSFGQENLQYSLEIEKGMWAVENLTNGVLLVSKDDKRVISIFCLKNEGITLQALESLIPTRLGLTEVQKKEGKNWAVLTGMRQGQPLNIELRDRESSYLLAVSLGLEKKEINK